MKFGTLHPEKRKDTVYLTENIEKPPHLISHPLKSYMTARLECIWSIFKIENEQFIGRYW